MGIQPGYGRQLDEAVDFLRGKSASTCRICLVLGSGWGVLTDLLGVAWSIPYRQIPFFPQPRVEGHRGTLRLAQLEGEGIYVLEGRFHLYEGHSAEQVVFPVRVLSGLGVETFVLTNAAGAVTPNLKPGQLMLIADQINLQGCSPLETHADREIRFLDLTNAFDPGLIALAREVALETASSVAEGVYLGVRGPCFETPAEIRAFRRLGANAVGMSTVQEVIALRELRRKVLGISLISNMGAGMVPEQLAHGEILRRVATSVRDHSDFLKSLLCRIARQDCVGPLGT